MVFQMVQLLLIYEEENIKKMDPLSGELALPGWDTSYTKEELQRFI